MATSVPLRCLGCNAQAADMQGRAGNTEVGTTPADAFKAAIEPLTDTLAGEGDAIATLDTVSSVFPRGRYDLSLYPGFMDMDGQNHQFKIRCGPGCTVAIICRKLSRTGSRFLASRLSKRSDILQVQNVVLFGKSVICLQCKWPRQS
jgi:hypothetical protein